MDRVRTGSGPRGARRRTVGFAVLAVGVAVAACDAEAFRAAWPKPKPVTAKRCDGKSVGRESLSLVLEAELDFDDGHVKRTHLVNARARKAPSTPQLDRVGECYSNAVDLKPWAKGKVVVQYLGNRPGGDVCLVRSAIDDGAFVSCVMEGLASLPAHVVGAEGFPSVVSVDFQPELENASREWYGTGEMRWDGNQAPRMRDVPESD